MRLALILATVVILSLTASCSSPSPDAQNYLQKNSVAADNQASSNEVVDVTAQTASALPTGMVKTAQPAAEDKLKQTVSPGNLPKCVDQFAGTKKVWEKMKDIKQHYGDSNFLLELGDRGFMNGNPLADMKAAVSPIPLFESWDTTKLTGIKNVKSFIAHGTQIRILSRHSAPEGNWYLVTTLSGGVKEVKGWVPEKLVSSTKAIPTGFGGVAYQGGACST
jgi:hypothetical protein